MSTNPDLPFAAAEGVSSILPMSAPQGHTTKRVIEPAERIAEVLFGLIMVLTFTGSLSVAEAGRADVRSMLVGALGCNLAWGVIDGLFYLMGCLAEKGRTLATYKAVLGATTAGRKRGACSPDALPPLVCFSCSRPEELDALRERALQPAGAAGRARGSTGASWLGGWARVPARVPRRRFPSRLPFMVFDNAIARDARSRTRSRS